MNSQFFKDLLPADWWLKPLRNKRWKNRWGKVEKWKNIGRFIFCCRRWMNSSSGWIYESWVSLWKAGKKSHSEEVSMVRKRAMKYQIERMEAQSEASLIDLSNEEKPGCLGCAVCRGLYYPVMWGFFFLAHLFLTFKPQAAIAPMRVVLSLLVGLNSFLWNGDLDKNGVCSDWAVWNKGVLSVFSVAYPCRFLHIFTAYEVWPHSCWRRNRLGRCSVWLWKSKTSTVVCLGMWGNRLKNVTLKSVLFSAPLWKP